MGEAKRRRKKAAPIELPITDGGPEITATTIFPTLDSMWMDFVERLPLLKDCSRERREMTKFAFYTSAAEVLRTVAFRINSDQSTAVFDDFDRELRAYDRELQRAAENYAAELN
jgi:hypothetical protein